MARSLHATSTSVASSPSTLAKMARRRLPDCICTRCRKVFRPKRSNTVTFCSRKCAFETRSERKQRRLAFARFTTYTRECLQCLRVFTSASRRAKVCSDACRQRRAAMHVRTCYYKLQAKPLVQKECLVCGAPFLPSRTGERVYYCSVRCSKRAHGKSYRARARWHGVEYTSINVFEVFERDAWHCQVCGRKTPKHYRGTTKQNAPELDHRVPMALGGGHTWDNVQCACRTCNASKAGVIVKGQLSLLRPLRTPPHPPHPRGRGESLPIWLQNRAKRRKKSGAKPGAANFVSEHAANGAAGPRDSAAT